MKLKLFTAGAAASLLLLTACGGGAPTAKSAADAGLKNMNDSLSYYMGMALSNGYNQMVMSDTTLKGDAARAQVLKAFGEGMSMFEGKSDAEIAGMAMALQTIMSNKQLSEQLGVTFNNQLIGSGFAYALAADTVTERATEGSKYIQDAFARLQTKQADKYKAAASKVISGYAKKGYTKVNDALYAKTTKPGNGAQLKDGDKVKIKMTAKDAQGKELTIPMPETAVVGQMFMGTPMAQSFSQMKMGETAEFVTGAFEMFQNPQQVKQMGLDPEGIVVFTIEAISLDDSKPQAPAVAKVKPADTAEAAPAPAKK